VRKVSTKRKYRFIRVKPDTWKALTYLKAHLMLPTFDSVIRYLIRYYREKELKVRK